MLYNVIYINIHIYRLDVRCRTSGATVPGFHHFACASMGWVLMFSNEAGNFCQDGQTGSPGPFGSPAGTTARWEKVDPCSIIFWPNKNTSRLRSTNLQNVCGKSEMKLTDLDLEKYFLTTSTQSSLRPMSRLFLQNWPNTASSTERLEDQNQMAYPKFQKCKESHPRGA